MRAPQRQLRGLYSPAFLPSRAYHPAYYEYAFHTAGAGTPRPFPNSKPLIHQMRANKSCFKAQKDWSGHNHCWLCQQRRTGGTRSLPAHDSRLPNSPLLAEPRKGGGSRAFQHTSRGRACLLENSNKGGRGDDWESFFRSVRHLNFPF